MPRPLKIFAFLLAAVWLPATVHCQLEQVGLDTLFACADGADDLGHDTGDQCTDDACQTIEAGQVALTKSRHDAASLALLAGSVPFCLFEIPAPSPAGEFVATRQDDVLPRQRTWQFDRRAALPARAPDTLNA